MIDTIVIALIIALRFAIRTNYMVDNFFAIYLSQTKAEQINPLHPNPLLSFPLPSTCLQSGSCRDAATDTVRTIALCTAHTRDGTMCFHNGNDITTWSLMSTTILSGIWHLQQPQPPTRCSQHQLNQ